MIVSASLDCTILELHIRKRLSHTIGAVALLQSRVASSGSHYERDAMGVGHFLQGGHRLNMYRSKPIDDDDDDDNKYRVFFYIIIIEKGHTHSLLIPNRHRHS